MRCSSSTQLQVETAQKQIPAGHLILVFLIDLVVMLQPDLCCSTAGLGASAQVRRGHESARGVTERQPRPSSVLLGRGTKHMSPDLQNI